MLKTPLTATKQKSGRPVRYVATEEAVLLRALLINAGMPRCFAASAKSGSVPPLNLATLAAHVRKHVAGSDIAILDEEYDDVPAALQAGKYDLVGISCNVMTYANALPLARLAKDCGLKVILGGPYPTSRPQEIMTNRCYVDGVVVGDGEDALAALVASNDWQSAPNTYWRDADGTCHQPRFHATTNIEQSGFADYRDLPLDRYLEQRTIAYADHKASRESLAISSRRGCIWRAQSGGCTFCMIPHAGIRYQTPRRVWSEVAHLKATYGIDSVWDVSDTFTENRAWVEEFARTRPRDLGVSLQVYARPNNISRAMVGLLRDCGVDEVFIGVESGDDRILRAMNKGATVADSRRAVELLAAADMDVVASFVFGLPNESAASLQRTVDLAAEFAAIANVREVSASVMLPIPGSPAFEMLSFVPEFASKHSSDVLDIEQLKRDWIRRFTTIQMDEAERALAETVERFVLTNSFASLQPDAASVPMC